MQEYFSIWYWQNQHACRNKNQRPKQGTKLLTFSLQPLKGPLPSFNNKPTCGKKWPLDRITDFLTTPLAYIHTPLLLNQYANLNINSSSFKQTILQDYYFKLACTAENAIFSSIIDFYLGTILVPTGQIGEYHETIK